VGKKRSQPKPRASAVPKPSGARAALRPILLRVAVGVTVTVFFLLVIEAVLRLFDCGRPTSYFVRLDDRGTLTLNPRFGWRFMPRATATEPWPVMLAARKTPGTVRIFVLGESAAQGTPAPAFGFGRILEVMLSQQYPQRRFEVVNLAMRGINSHVVREIARESAALQPDLFLIYMGNNEAIGLHAPEPGRFNLTPYLRILRASQWARSTRLGASLQDAAHALRKHPAKREQDMVFFRRNRLVADAPERTAVYDNFKANLEDILRIAQASGARTLLSTVAVNLQDFPPLASLHRAGLEAATLAQWEAAYGYGTNAEACGRLAEAVTNYLEAVRLDEGFAELHFRLARCQVALGQIAPARQHFGLARDWDALQFRTDGRLNRIIRETAVRRAGGGVVLVDAEKAFAEDPGNVSGVPGGRQFYEHAHLTFDGDYLLARTFFDALTQTLGLAGASAAGPPPSRAECAGALAFSEWDEVGVNAAMVRLTSRPPFLDQLEHDQRQRAAEEIIRQRTDRFRQPEVFRRSAETYQAAIGRRPDDWLIRFNFGNLLRDFNQRAEGAAQYSAGVRLMPVFLPMRVALAQLLWDTGKQQEALDQLREALRINPGYAPAREALAGVSVTRGFVDLSR
jgi:tetratricopeptide (TPR) repeat protein